MLLRSLSGNALLQPPAVMLDGNLHVNTDARNGRPILRPNAIEQNTTHNCDRA